MERMMKEYPESEGYVHSIDLKWVKSHDFLLKLAAFREKNKT